MNPVYPNQSECLRKIRFHSDWSVWPDSFGLIRFDRIHSDYKFGLILNGPRIDSNKNGMKLFGSDTNPGIIRKISDWFGLNFNPKLSSGFFFAIMTLIHLQILDSLSTLRLQNKNSLFVDLLSTWHRKYSYGINMTVGLISGVSVSLCMSASSARLRIPVTVFRSWPKKLRTCDQLRWFFQA